MKIILRVFFLMRLFVRFMCKEYVKREREPIKGKQREFEVAPEQGKANPYTHARAKTVPVCRENSKKYSFA